MENGLAEYVKSLFTKNSKLLIIPVIMNKKKAAKALYMLNKLSENLDLILDSPDDEFYSECQDAITWLRNQILKKYSISQTIL